MAKKSIPIEKIELYDKLIATIPEIVRKGKTCPYTSLNGNMFTYLSGEGILGLRMSKEDGEAFEALYKSEPFVQYGAVMKDYVTVPNEVLEDTDTAKKYLIQSYEYAKTLKPKATKKKKQ